MAAASECHAARLVFQSASVLIADSVRLKSPGPSAATAHRTSWICGYHADSFEWLLRLAPVPSLSFCYSRSYSEVGGV